MIKEFHVSKNLFDEQYANLDTTIRYKPIYVGNGTFTLSSTAPLASGSAAMIFFLTGERSGGADTSTNGVSSGISRTVTATNGYVTVAYRIAYNISPIDYNTMLNEGSSPLPYEPYGNKWNTKSYVKSITGVQTYTKFPIVLRTTDQSIPTWGMDGNVETSGTPSPTNPVEVNGVGERTENLLKNEQTQTVVENNGITFTRNSDGSITANGTATARAKYQYYGLDAWKYAFDTDYFLSGCPTGGSTSTYSLLIDSTATQFRDTGSGRLVNVASGTTGTYNFEIRIENGIRVDNLVFKPMLNSGSTAKPYEPFGYKIPILTNQGSTVNYLGSVQSYREIAKYIFDGTDNFKWTKSGTRNFSWFFNPLFLPDRGKESTPFLCSHGATATTLSEFVYGTVYADNTYNLGIFPPELSTVTEVRQWLATQYANGTPVTIWYSLYTPITGVVNEPLMKIGDYADTLSNATPIPTTSGLNTIDINTTIKPSEMSLTYDGYKICKPKRKSENLLPTAMSDWQQGGISSADGTDTISTIRLRTIGYYPIANDTYYYISVRDTNYCYVNLIFYDSNKNFIGQYYTIDGAINGATALAIRIPSSTFQNVAYYRAVVKKQNESTITVQNIIDVKPMLNTGSTALPYEPYWK